MRPLMEVAASQRRMHGIAAPNPAMFPGGVGTPVTTILFILVGWLALNVLFVVGMYFRPVRKAEATSAELRLSEAGEAPAGNRPEIVTPIAAPGTRGKVFLFGLWLDDRQHPV